MSPNSEGWASAKPAEAPHGRAVYRFGTAIIEVGIDDHEVALWLEEFLTPWFSAEAPGQTGFHVRMTVSKERFATLVRREAESSLRPLACFGLDSALVSYPGWIEADGTTIVADEEFCCYYRVGDNLVEVVARPQDRQARIGLMRVVRELAALCTLARPEILDLHAAAFVFRGRAVLLAGDKKAGKTTLLAHALASRQAALLANDRVIVEESQLQAHGVPTVVAVRGGTEQRFSALGRGLPRRATLLHAGELALANASQAGAGQRLVLSPAQFARQLGARIEPQAPVGAVVFPEISSDTSAWSLSPVTPAEAAARLRRSLYGSRAGPRCPTIFQDIAGEPLGADARGDLVNRLATTVPQIRCVLGKDAYRDGADTWLRALSLDYGAALP